MPATHGIAALPPGQVSPTHPERQVFVLGAPPLSCLFWLALPARPHFTLRSSSSFILIFCFSVFVSTAALGKR